MTSTKIRLIDSTETMYLSGGYLTKFYTVRLRPEFQPLTPYLQFLKEKLSLSYILH